jgi:hypothetical protein
VKWLLSVRIFQQCKIEGEHTFSIKCSTPFFVMMSVFTNFNPLTRFCPSLPYVILIGVPARLLYVVPGYRSGLCPRKPQIIYFFTSSLRLSSLESTGANTVHAGVLSKKSSSLARTMSAKNWSALPSFLIDLEKTDGSVKKLYQSAQFHSNSHPALTQQLQKSHPCQTQTAQISVSSQLPSRLKPEKSPRDVI